MESRLWASFWSGWDFNGFFLASDRWGGWGRAGGWRWGLQPDCRQPVGSLEPCGCRAECWDAKSQRCAHKCPTAGESGSLATVNPTRPDPSHPHHHPHLRHSKTRQVGTSAHRPGLIRLWGHLYWFTKILCRPALIITKLLKVVIMVMIYRRFHSDINGVICHSNVNRGLQNTVKDKNKNKSAWSAFSHWSLVLHH